MIAAYDPRGPRWPTSATQPPPAPLTSTQQRVLLFAGPACRARAVELGYITDECSEGDWQKIVKLGPFGFDKVMILRGVWTVAR